jgi:hypothetical protein
MPGLTIGGQLVPTGFCWFCYKDSVERVAVNLPQPMRLAVLMAAREHKPQNLLASPGTSAHAMHAHSPLVAGEGD